MRKQTKRNLVVLAVVALLIASTSIFIAKKVGIGSRSSVRGQLRDEKNNEIVFSGSLFHDYINIMLESRDSKNIEDGLNFDIINPKGEIVESGKLYDNKVFRESYESKSGEWKIVIHFTDNDESAMINSGIAINSSKKNTMRIE